MPCEKSTEIKGSSQPQTGSCVTDFQNDHTNHDLCIYVHGVGIVHFSVESSIVDILMIFTRAELIVNILTLRSSCQVRWLQPVAQSWKFHYRHT